MRRFEAIRRIMDAVTDELVVCNLGHPSQELFQIKDRPENFYMLGSMGLASSIGLGIALSTDRTVIVIDGDGSVLMNLGTLATIGVTQPENYILVIVDNESYGSTGFQPTFTGMGLQLCELAKACNISKTLLITQEADITPTMRDVFRSGRGPYCIIVKTNKGAPDTLTAIPHDATAIRDRFMGSIEPGPASRQPDCPGDTMRPWR